MRRLLLPLAILASPAAFAQEAEPAPSPAVSREPTSLAAEPGLPRTPDGHPDFQSAVWAVNYFPVWDTNPMSADLVVSEAEARRIVDTMVKGMSGIPDFQIDPEADIIIGGSDGLPLVRGERRTRLIVVPADGKVPLTPEAKKIIADDDAEPSGSDSYEQRPTSERCLVLSGDPPAFSTVSYNRMQFVQTPDHVVIHNENGDEARIIPFATQHGPVGPQSWYGDSIARWEGDTLVVETIRQSPRTRIRGLFGKFLVTPDSKVIERFTRVSADELLYQFTVEDPMMYSAPWLAEYSFHATDTGMYPSPCHEANYSLPNILMAARVAERRGKQ